MRPHFAAIPVASTRDCRDREGRRGGCEGGSYKLKVGGLRLSLSECLEHLEPGQQESRGENHCQTALRFRSVALGREGSGVQCQRQKKDRDDLSGGLIESDRANPGRDCDERDSRRDQSDQPLGAVEQLRPKIESADQERRGDDSHAGQEGVVAADRQIDEHDQ